LKIEENVKCKKNERPHKVGRAARARARVLVQNFLDFYMLVLVENFCARARPIFPQTRARASFARARDARAKFLDFYMLVLVLKNFVRARARPKFLCSSNPGPRLYLRSLFCECKFLRIEKVFVFWNDSKFYKF
jgi:hypothetical protein